MSRRNAPFRPEASTSSQSILIMSIAITITAPAEAMEAKRLPPVRTSRKPLEVRATYAIRSVRTNFPVNRETNVLIGLYRITPSGMKMTSSGRGSAANAKAAREGSAGSVSKGVACEFSDRGAQGGDCCDWYEAEAGVRGGDKDDEQQVWDGKERDNVADYAGDEDA